MEPIDKSLTKAERKLERKRLRQKEVEQERRQAKRKTLVTKLALAVLILAAGWWIYQTSNTKPPGETVPDLGRDHVPEGTAVEYNSNPPTSGPHYAQWEKPGVYDQPLTDGRLIHSLEHGYIVISYNCEKIPDNQNCQDLVGQLKSLMEKSKAKRLILVPRPSLDSRIALTAWGRIDKMEDVDESRILRFIRAYHNKGPERTME